MVVQEHGVTGDESILISEYSKDELPEKQVYNSFGISLIPVSDRFSSAEILADLMESFQKKGNQSKFADTEMLIGGKLAYCSEGKNVSVLPLSVETISQEKYVANKLYCYVDYGDYFLDVNYSYRVEDKNEMEDVFEKILNSIKFE